LEDFLPLINKIERRTMGLNQLLGYHGRMLLVNSVLSALPTFYLCSLKIPVNLLEQVDKYRMHCLRDVPEGWLSSSLEKSNKAKGTGRPENFGFESTEYSTLL
jgi:hypothetical protein